MHGPRQRALRAAGRQVSLGGQLPQLAHEDQAPPAEELARQIGAAVRAGARKISRDLFGLWTRRLTGLTPKVRSEDTDGPELIQFQARDGAVPFVPEWKRSPKWLDKTPRLVSEVEMARVLATAASLPPTWHDPLRSKTVRIALVLLFCCGLRLGELARLKLCDFDPQQETLWIENTKFSKSRFVPLSRSAADELCDYWAERRRHHFHYSCERMNIMRITRSDGLRSATEREKVLRIRSKE